jgi:tRNA A37 threonylcarbamoyladenosine dehydratase
MIESNQFPAAMSIARLYGPQAPARLAQAHVVILGLGGVGSWAAEALVRSGLGSLTLVDPDDVCISNIGRQVHTLYSTVGQPKVMAMANRLRDIAPHCKINPIATFFDSDSAHSIVTQNKTDFVFDAIDRLKNKLLAIELCRQNDIPFLISGAAGGKASPWDVRIDDLSRCIYDPLLMRLRKNMRRHQLAPRGKKLMHIPCVFSAAPMRYVDPDGGICSVKTPGQIPKLDCHQGLGVAAAVTGTFGLFAAAYILEKIVSDKVAVHDDRFSHPPTP